jgi:hypothetical protein
MRVLIVLCFMFICSCQEDKKPDNLISKEVMIDIITDLAVLEAVQSHNPSLLQLYGINPKEYVYDKYRVDSMQLAQSNRYYALNIKEYDAMYEKVKVRLEQQKAEIDSSLKLKITQPQISVSMDSIRSEKSKTLHLE